MFSLGQLNSKAMLRGFWRQMADENWWSPPICCNQETSVVKDRDGRMTSVSIVIGD